MEAKKLPAASGVSYFLLTGTIPDRLVARLSESNTSRQAATISGVLYIPSDDLRERHVAGRKFLARFFLVG